MATSVADLRARLGVDRGDYYRDLDRADRRFSQSGDRWRKEANKTSIYARSRLGKLTVWARSGAGIASILGGSAVAVAAKKSIDAASNLAEQINKTSVVFRGSEKEILEWGKTTADTFFISNRQALEAAGTFGNMLVPMGFARREAGQMSMTMVELASDMASFNNASPEETLDALRAGLAGETEPLRRFGVRLSAARLETIALEEGIIKSESALKKQGGQLTDQQKALATYATILKDTSDQQGDSARTAGSLANQQRRLRARFEDLSAALGEKLLPVASQFLEWAIQFVDFIERHGDTIKKFLLGVAAGALDAAEELLRMASVALFVYENLLKAAAGIMRLVPGMGELANKTEDAADELRDARKKTDEWREQLRLLEDQTRRRYQVRVEVSGFSSVNAMRQNIQDLRAGLGDFTVKGAYGGTASGLVGIGRNLQALGFQVWQHPAFGGVTGGHAQNSYHYQGRAIDVNWPGGGFMELMKLRSVFGWLSRFPYKELMIEDVGQANQHLHMAMDKAGWYNLKPGLNLVGNWTGRPEPVYATGKGGAPGLTLNINGPVYGNRRQIFELFREAHREFEKRNGR